MNFLPYKFSYTRFLLEGFITYLTLTHIGHTETLGDTSCRNAKKLVRWFDQKSFQMDIKPFLKNEAFTILKDQNDRYLLVFSSFATPAKEGVCLENRFFMKQGNTFYQLSQDYAGYVDDTNFLPSKEVNTKNVQGKDVSESRIQGPNDQTILLWRSLDAGKESLETRCCMRDKQGLDHCPTSGILFTAISKLEQKRMLAQTKLASLPQIPKPVVLLTFTFANQTKYVYVDMFDPDPRLAIPFNIRLFIGSLEDMKPQKIAHLFSADDDSITLQTSQGATLILPAGYRYPLELTTKNRKGFPIFKIKGKEISISEVILDGNNSQKLSVLKNYPIQYQQQLKSLCEM